MGERCYRAGVRVRVRGDGGGVFDRDLVERAIHGPVHAAGDRVMQQVAERLPVGDANTGG